MGLPRNTTSARARPALPPVDAINAALAARYPDAHTELDHRNAFELLCATILAAQSTDRMINTITPGLFARYPDARALARAEPAELEPLVFKSGFYRNKARSLLGMARALVERHGGEVPRTMAELVALPGVARKTANVILHHAFGLEEGVIVDTHVTRLAQRLGLTRETDAVKIEQALMQVVPRAEWGNFAERLIWHGRRTCFARNPACGECPLAPLCPSANIPGRAAAPAKATATAKATPVGKAKATPARKPGTGTGKATGKGPSRSKARA